MRMTRAGPADSSAVDCIRLNMTYLDVIFLHGLDHASTDGKPAFFSFSFCPTDMTNTTIRKNTKATTTCLKKTGFPFVCTCGSNTRLKSRIEIRKIERGMPVMTLVLVTTYLLNVEEPFVFFLSYLLMGDELGSATDIDRLLVSSGPSIPKISP